MKLKKENGDHGDQIWANFRLLVDYFLWAVFQKWPNILRHYFPLFTLCLILDKKLGWATFWVTFSQTHLVTLSATLNILDQGIL
jgi:hypothetical protein